MPSTASLKLAVVGSGPAGCYLAQSLLRAVPEIEITIFDRLVSPFGLVRYGVAADHQHTKGITRQFDRLFQDPRVRFAGNIDIGSQLTLAALREAFDAVVLATGLSDDRSLDVPGGELQGVFGAGMITRVLNSHPDEHPSLPDLGSDVVIVGGGNVAADLLRFLVKDASGYEQSDIAQHALESYLSSPAQRVTLLNRSAPADMKSDPQMLKELAALPRARYSSPDFDGTAPVDADRTGVARIAALTELTSSERPAYPGPEVSLRFGSTPVQVLGEGRVEGVEIEVGGELSVIPATSVLTAIGFRHAENHLSELLAEPAETGRVDDGLYRTGWARRGPTGAIPANRACAKQVADEIVADLANGTLSANGAPGFAGLPGHVHEAAISYDEWLDLDRHEMATAADDRARAKVSDHGKMLSIARNTSTTERNTQP